ncbi:Aldo/keto reductase [Stereum hirsutum FP-91666 SS1]|uniref:Aldo/keto reductase n=1 Tax=Stereum hirsutum (strain FP-91666) TaxID=721885 RepID=UPI0004449B63|nr:Aldo/keto reductase [Stereum hirsutum FP-91666 SS1]EIM83812.1 Aldo/keto reductase [Stereum hirsutum FP-91666 SS1]
MSVPGAQKNKPLACYRILSPLCGLRVSPIALGGMSLGDKWAGMGEMTKKKGFELLDAYYEMGGNFVDTANNYQDEVSEEWVGEWMEQRGNRDQIVVATKYSCNYKLNAPATQYPIKVSYVGNNAKSLHISLEASLKKLRTSYVDILYLHWWDFGTGVEEVMNSLHVEVMRGRVLYLGVSDTPAWVVAKANQYARDHGKTPFCIYQGRWNVLERSFERDIIPMARSEGLALAPWDVLVAGRLRSNTEEEARNNSGENGRMMYRDTWKRSDEETKMAKVLEEIAMECGLGDAGNTSSEGGGMAVAIAYVMQKTTYVFPILGGRKVTHLRSNLRALKIQLTEEHMSRIEGVAKFQVGFPNSIIGDGFKEGSLLAEQRAATEDLWPLAQPIMPRSL